MNQNLIILFSLLFITNIIDIHGDIEEHLKEDFFKIYTNVALIERNVTNEPVNSDDVTFYLYTKENPTEYTQLDSSNPKINNKNNATIVLLIHGWTGSRENSWYETLKNDFLDRKENFKVIQVDWRKPANEIYTISSYNTIDVGKIVGEFITNLWKKSEIPLDNFLLVGHSLGGQLAGFVGKNIWKETGRKLPRIIALDPAGPLFISRPDEERLNKNDAEVVAVIHTNGGVFGFVKPCGTIDFFANGGSHQTGCTHFENLTLKEISDTVSCDHHRSYEYFMEAMTNPGSFMAMKCKNYIAYNMNMCSNDEMPMGDILKTTKTGNFFLKTKGESPFSM